MDYLKMLQYHIEKNADLSISCIHVAKDQANRFGIVDIDENYRVTRFLEKPKNPPEIPNKPGFSFVNMGIYIFNAEILKNVLSTMEKKGINNTDFGKHVIPYMVKEDFKIQAFRFEDENKKVDPYWVDVGTIDSYYAASMDLINVTPHFNLYDDRWPMRTKLYQLPPVKTLSHEGERVGRAFNSLITDGTIISGGLVERSILGPNVKINSYTYITDSILMDNCDVGRHSRIRRAIIDKNVKVPEGTEIGFDSELDKKKFTVTETGIVVIPKGYVFE